MLYTYGQRLNVVAFHALTVLFICAVLSAMSTHWHKGEAVIKRLDVSELKYLKTGSGVDRAMLNVDIDADLRPIWNWNVKQLFVFITAEYTTPSNAVNQVVIWDKIITEQRRSLIKKTSMPSKYTLFDQYDELRGKELKLTLGWDIMPYTGLLYTQFGGNSTYTLPKSYK